jgi:hypothetical protein
MDEAAEFCSEDRRRIERIGDGRDGSGEAYENHTIFSLPSFSKCSLFVSAGKLSDSGKLQLGNHRKFFRTPCGAKS